MKKVCATCKHDGVEPCNEPCILCRYGSDGIPTEWEGTKHYKPQTNADRIRAMSDEELAKFLESFGCCHNCAEHHRLGDVRFYSDEKCDEQCQLHLLEWLQQPAK